MAEFIVFTIRIFLLDEFHLILNNYSALPNIFGKVYLSFTISLQMGNGSYSYIELKSVRIVSFTISLQMGNGSYSYIELKSVRIVQL